MSDLSRLNLKADIPSVDASEKQKLYQELSSDPAVIRLLKTHNIPEQSLWDNLYTFARWQKEVAPCRGCKSLSHCRQKKKGYHMGLSYEGLLVETLEACNYEREKQQAARAGERRSQVGTGDRSERIRTYNYPQGRVTDHRIGLTLYKLDAVLNGALDELIDALITADTAEKLKNDL